MIPLAERWHVVCRSCDGLEELAPSEADAGDLADEHVGDHPDHTVATAPVTPRGERVATDGGIDVDVDALGPAYARLVDARLARDDQTGAWTRARDETCLTERVGGPREDRTHVVAFTGADGAHDVTLVDVEPEEESRRYLAACDCIGFRSGDAACSHVLAVAREHVLRDHYVPDPREFVGASASPGGPGDDGLRADGGEKQ